MFSRSAIRLSHFPAVHLSFLDFEKGADKNLLYADEVYKTIKKHKASSPLASYKDICVLVRKRKEGVAVANHLISKGLDIISNETLLITESKEIPDVFSHLEMLKDELDEIKSFKEDKF